MKDKLAVCVIGCYFAMIALLIIFGIFAFIPPSDSFTYLEKFTTYTSPFVGMILGHYFFPKA